MDREDTFCSVVMRAHGGLLDWDSSLCGRKGERTAMKSVGDGDTCDYIQCRCVSELEPTSPTQEILGKLSEITFNSIRPWSGPQQVVAQHSK